MPNKLRELIKAFGRNKAKLLRTIGELVVNDALQNFKNEAFEGAKWKPRKDGSSAGARKSRRNLLVKSGKLRRSVRVVSISKDSVIVGSDVPYAKAHNEGFSGSVSVEAHKRKRKIKTYVTSIKTKKTTKRKVLAGFNEVKAHNRNMNIPQRQFIGITPQLKEKIKKKILSGLFKVK
jgi:phage gpG-like protein